MASLHSCNQEVKPSPEDQRKSKTLHECQVINFSPLEVGQRDKLRPEPGSELKDFRIYEDDDDRTIHIKADQEPRDKA